MPRVSVIIPCYNRNQYISEAVSSVLNQSYKDFEIIVVDDGSSIDVISSLALYGEKVKIVSQSHKGPSSARNTGVRNACGEYVAFLDDDDLFEADKLLKEVNLLDNHPRAGFSYSGCYFFRSGREKKIKIPESSKWPADQFVESYFLDTDITMPSLLIRRTCFLEAGLFDENIYHNEDADMWFRMGLRYPVKYSPYPSASVRLHTRRSSHNNPLMIKGLIDILNKLLESNPGLKHKLGERADKKIAYLNYVLGWSYLARNGKQEAIERFAIYRDSIHRRHSKRYIDGIIHMLDRVDPYLLFSIHSRLIGIKRWISVS